MTDLESLGIGVNIKVIGGGGGGNNTINRMIVEHSTDLEAMAQTYMDAESQAMNRVDSLPASTL